MLKNYLRTAWRNLLRHKLISIINLLGLTVGLTCCLLILVYIINELSYDRFNTKADRIYRVTRSFYSSNGTENLHLSAIAPPFGPALRTAFPEIEKITRILHNSRTVLQYGDKLFNETNAFYADENFTEVFNLQMLKGDPHTALKEPYQIMLTEDIARKYFSNADPMNKGIMLDNNKHEYKVTGVYKPLPTTSHMHPGILLSFNTLKDSTIYGEKNLAANWGNNSFYTYLLLPAGYNPARISHRLDAFVDQYMRQAGYPSTMHPSKFTKLSLQKLTDIHLRSHLDDELEQNGDIRRVYIFAVIAAFILLIACINYMNLSTARSALRAKEIGIRKAIGAQRQELIRQFLSEAVLVTCISMVMAAVFTCLLLPQVDAFSGLSLSLRSLNNVPVLAALVLLPFVIGLVSGLYPALFMSSFNPVRVLKGYFAGGMGNVSLRQVLVVVQFAISIILIMATTVVFQQLRYMQQKSLGFNKDHIITLRNVGGLNAKFDTFRSALLRNPAIEGIGRSSRIPSSRLLDYTDSHVYEHGALQPVKVDLKFLVTDDGFVPTYGMRMKAGRNFSHLNRLDSAGFILNETAVQSLGWKDAQSAIGKDIKYGDGTGKVIGVVQDFHFESLHQKIVPMIFLMPSGSNPGVGNYSVKVDGRKLASAIETLKATWQKFQPEVLFEYHFLDERFQQLYDSEQQQGSLFTIFSCVAIFIACLGLLGLSAFTITQRIKEIGVRKVLGASIPQIVAELSKDFFKLVIIAAIIALPVSWYAMSRWLLDFAFRIHIQWWMFLMAGSLALLIAFVTISFQSIKAALANPVKSLRSE